jgi:DNA-binding protein YbaB
VSEHPGAAGLRAQAESLRAGFERIVAEGPAAQARARAVEVTRESPDGLVSVTVDAQGVLLDLDVDPRIYRRPDAGALADAIVETVQLAATEARERVLECFAALVPAEQLRPHLDGDLDGVLEQMTRQMLGGGQR